MPIDAAKAAPDPDSLLKKAIWLYFILLIFEGALRKWVLPFLATPLLIVRDPVALYVVYAAYKRGYLSGNGYITGLLAVGILGIITAVFVGHGSVPVALFGARVLLLHFPLIFAIGRIFTRDDVIKMGRATLWIAIPMALLIGMQFYSPQDSFVNRGVGGDEAGAGFSGAMGYMRPPGTFSFTTGTTLFFGFAASFIFYFWFNSRQITKLALIGATAGLLAAIPLSISRALLFQVLLCTGFTVLAISRKPKYLGKLIVGGLAIAVVLLVLGKTSFFQTSTEAFTDRFDNANEAEGGLQGVLVDRFLGGLMSALASSANLPLFGYGIGKGSNVGSMLLTGTNDFLVAEGEWGRLVGELGPLLGLVAIFLRIGLTIKLGLISFKRLATDDLLPWMLASSGLLLMAQGDSGQPSALGFLTVTAGLIIASFNVPQEPTYTGIQK